MLIFGGSSGIGLATAKEAAKQGASRIIIVGRSEDKLAAAKREIETTVTGRSVEVTAHSIDVMDEEKVREFFGTLPNRSIDHLVTTPGGRYDVYEAKECT